MSLGDKLLTLRKKSGMSQEEVAEKLEVSRQTVSKWETGQTAPELIKAKQISEFFNVSYNSLVSEAEFSDDLTSMESASDEIDWTSAWAKKYPVLLEYQKNREMDKYYDKISDIAEEFQEEFETSVVDTFLILKDMLYQRYKVMKKKPKE